MRSESGRYSRTRIKLSARTTHLPIFREAKGQEAALELDRREFTRCGTTAKDTAHVDARQLTRAGVGAVGYLRFGEDAAQAPDIKAAIHTKSHLSGGYAAHAPMHAAPTRVSTDAKDYGVQGEQWDGITSTDGRVFRSTHEHAGIRQLDCFPPWDPDIPGHAIPRKAIQNGRNLNHTTLGARQSLLTHDLPLKGERNALILDDATSEFPPARMQRLAFAPLRK